MLQHGGDADLEGAAGFGAVVAVARRTTMMSGMGVPQSRDEIGIFLGCIKAPVATVIAIGTNTGTVPPLAANQADPRRAIGGVIPQQEAAVRRQVAAAPAGEA